MDVAKSQTLIESRLNQIRGDLPPNVNISVERMNPAILPVMGYTLEAPGRSALELRKLALGLLARSWREVLQRGRTRVQGRQHRLCRDRGQEGRRRVRDLRGRA